MSQKAFQQKYVPHRTMGGLASRAQILGVKRREWWTEAESDILREYYPILRPEEVTKMLPGRSKNAVILYAEKLGLENYFNKTYSAEDNEYIRRHYLDMSDAEIGMVLHRAAQSIKEQRRQLGLKKPRPGTWRGYNDLGSFLRNHNYAWKKASMRKCGYACVVTGGRFDAIHHLYGMNMIVDAVFDRIGELSTTDVNKITEKEKELLLNVFYEEQSKYPLGVCLSAEVHKAFHDKYGYGNNTPEQFEEFLSRQPHKRDIA